MADQVKERPIRWEQPYRWTALQITTYGTTMQYAYDLATGARVFDMPEPDVWFFDRALTADEMRAIANDPSPLNCLKRGGKLKP